jgi:hypothetical protein
MSGMLSNHRCVLCAGERSLFVLTDSGKVRLMKKFDFNPRCFQPYMTCSLLAFTSKLSIPDIVLESPQVVYN